MQARIEAFLKEMDIPSFIVFGWKKNDTEFGIVSSQHKVPVNAAIKGMTWALNDFANKAL